MEQRIVCAALKLDQEIICGPRHYDRIMIGQIRFMPLEQDWRISEQGFVDQRGNFLTREEAFVVATNANQIIRRVGGDNGKLFSENLY